ncbi:transporter [Paenibacillus selenitireducens]|uniref:Transporter n=1 Tax=Paenibacillus selenitireducens TaxID=1324314 RepID=A0A1T2X5Z8_9BACL|nr:transporter [Paenibacillus selenitireducens]OPA75314.1 transporter [Paenibacillus selenitireducens]
MGFFPSPFNPPQGPFMPGQQFPIGPQGPQGTMGQAPTAPPPPFEPQQPQVSAFAVDPGAIAGCLFRNTFIWLTNGNRFWFYPIFVGRTSVAGFRWTGRNWMYFGIDLNQISSFTCF